MLTRLLALALLVFSGGLPSGWARRTGRPDRDAAAPPSMSREAVGELLADLAAKGAKPERATIDPLPQPRRLCSPRPTWRSSFGGRQIGIAGRPEPAPSTPDLG